MNDGSIRPAVAQSSARMRAPRTVWALGFVSLFTDVSSEIIHPLLPVFLTTTLGASVALLRLIDGIGESTASITKVFSGYISDCIGRQKPLILVTISHDYSLGAYFQSISESWTNGFRFPITRFAGLLCDRRKPRRG